MYDTPKASLLQNSLSGALIQSLPTTYAEEEVPDLRRKLEVARSLFAAWTHNGTHDAALAERFLDGSVHALESYILDRAVTDTDGNPASFKEVVKNINKVTADNLPYEDFVLHYMLPNKPVLIKGCNSGWPAHQDWVLGDGSIDLAFLVRHFGNSRIVASETDRQSHAYGVGKKHEMTLGEYADYWAEHKGGRDDRLLYLKDWHFVSEHPGYVAYRVPHYFADDWLNDYYHVKLETAPSLACRSQADITTSDYRFVYLGPKGSFTPVHTDVLHSFSWSTNISGRKKWLLLSPEHSALLYDRFGREVAPSFNLAALDSEAISKYPNLATAAQRVLEIEQGPGEVLFVPSGWHHSVENLEDTLSINHNWINAFNLHWVWSHCQQEHASAIAAIEDCRNITSTAEFEELVQRNMSQNCGADYCSLSGILAAAMVKQIRRLTCNGLDEIDAIVARFGLQRCLHILQPLTEALAASASLESPPAAGHSNPANATFDFTEETTVALQRHGISADTCHEALNAVLNYQDTASLLSALKHLYRIGNLALHADAN